MENPEKNIGDVGDMGTEQNMYTYNYSPRGREDKNGAAQYLRIQWIFQTRWTSGHRVQMCYEPQAEYVLRNSHLGKSQKNCWKTKTKKISRTAKGKSKHYLPRNNSKTGSWLPNKTAKARMKWMTSSKYWNKYYCQPRILCPVKIFFKMKMK